MNNPRSPSSRTSILPEPGGPSGVLRCWPITLLLLLAVDAGCSRPRKPSEDVDWGQTKPSVARRAPPREHRSDPAGGGNTAGSASEEQENNAGAEPHGGGDGKSGGDGKESESGDDAPPASGAGEAPGAGGGGPGGASNTPPAELEQPAPALPGREPVKPAMSAAEAADSAKRLLKRAQQLLRADDTSAAAEAAIEAYDQVLPHAESDQQCKKLCKQLEGVLTAAGRGRGQAEAVPTRFE